MIRSTRPLHMKNENTNFTYICTNGIIEFQCTKTHIIFHMFDDSTIIVFHSNGSSVEHTLHSPLPMFVTASTTISIHGSKLHTIILSN